MLEGLIITVAIILIYLFLSMISTIIVAGTIIGRVAKTIKIKIKRASRKIKG